MSLYEQIRKISLIFFVVIGLSHFITGLLFVNGYYREITGVTNRVLFIPFVLALFSYLYSGVKSEENNNSKLAILILIVGLLVIIGTVALEIFLPDAQNPLRP